MRLILILLAFVLTTTSCVMEQPIHANPYVTYSYVYPYYPRPYYTRHVHVYHCQHNYRYVGAPRR